MTESQPPAAPPSTELLQTQLLELRTLVDQIKGETGKDSPTALAAIAKAQEAIDSGTASSGRIEALEKRIGELSQKLEEALTDPAAAEPQPVKLSGQPPAAPANSPPAEKPRMAWW